MQPDNKESPGPDTSDLYAVPEPADIWLVLLGRIVIWAVPLLVISGLIFIGK